MKKIKQHFKLLIGIILAICGISLLLAVIENLKYVDPWGLGFTFFTLPSIIICIGFFISSFIIIKEWISKK